MPLADDCHLVPTRFNQAEAQEQDGGAKLLLLLVPDSEETLVRWELVVRKPSATASPTTRWSQLVVVHAPDFRGGDDPALLRQLVEKVGVVAIYHYVR